MANGVEDSIADDVAMLREMIRSSRPHSGSEEAHDAWDEAIDRAYATLDKLVEQLESKEREKAIEDEKNYLRKLKEKYPDV